VALREVAYLIHANPVLTDRANQPRAKPPDADEPEGADTEIKYISMFNRRLAKGQCFQRPYLGCREFACSFAAPDGSEQPLDWNDGLGWMLYDIHFGQRGRHLPGFFEARVVGGVIHCDRMNLGPNDEPPIVVHGWPRHE
jgi:CRISPR-associated protein Cas5d